MKSKLLLVDGNSLFHRAYHAVPRLETGKGELVNAVFGFFSILLYSLEKEQPLRIAVAFDKGKKTFRNQMFAAYKAHRPPAPEELYPQLPRVKELLSVMGIAWFDHDEYEADDIIGSLAREAHEEGDTLTLILTSDMDALQLVKEDVWVAAPQNFRERVYYTPEEVLGRKGLTPTAFLDYKALRGDASDNIPGVPGVGEKTALKLLQQFATLDGVYASLDHIGVSLKQKLVAGRESAFLSKKLATIATDGPFSLKKTTGPWQENLMLADVFALFSALEFNTLQARLKKLLPPPVKNPTPVASAQISLF